MEILHEPPPIFDEIVAAFPSARKGVIFAWAGRIYNPDAVRIGDSLLAHEGAHCLRQGSDPEAWWRRYLDDPAWRLAEEIIGHQAEYRQICSFQRDRNFQARSLHAIAMRLSGPLYGRLIPYARARAQVAA